MSLERIIWKWLLKILYKYRLLELPLFMFNDLFISDCLVYNITTRANSIGTCPTLETQTGVASLSYCLTLCLDRDKCRGATYHANKTCLLHDCANGSEDTNGATLIKRHCFGLWIFY